MNERVAHIEAILPTLATKADIESVRTDFRDVASDMKKWTLTTSWTVVAVGVIGLFGLLFTIYNTNKPAATGASQPTTQSAPIIIQVPAYQATSASAAIAPAKGAAR